MSGNIKFSNNILKFSVQIGKLITQVKLTLLLRCAAILCCCCCGKQFDRRIAS